MAIAIAVAGACLAAAPAGSSEPQKPPVQQGAQAVRPATAPPPAPAQQETRPAQPPAPFRPAETVSPSRKLSMPNDM